MGKITVQELVQTLRDKLNNITVTQSVDLDTMESDISTNTGDISTNASNISSNDTDISNLQTNKADTGVRADSTKEFVVEQRTTEPSSLPDGRMWIRTDL